jgi:hypothetical protein
MDDATQLSNRIQYLKRVFARGLGHKPRTLEALAIDRAARMTVLAERTAADPSASLADKVRTDNAMARSRAALDAVLAASKPRELTLGDILAGREPTPTHALVAGARR